MYDLVLPQPLVGLRHKASVGGLGAQFIGNGVAVGMVEYHARVRRKAGLHGRFRPTPGGAGEWAEQQIGKRVKPSVHRNHARIYHSWVGTIHPQPPLPQTGKVHCIVRQCQLAAPVRSKLGEIFFGWAQYAIGKTVQAASDRRGKNHATTLLNARRDEPCEQYRSKVIDCHGLLQSMSRE